MFKDFDITLRFLHESPSCTSPDDFEHVELDTDESEPSTLLNHIDVIITNLTISHSTFKTNTLTDSTVLTIENINIFDYVKESGWRKFMRCARYVNGYPRETDSNILKIVVDRVDMLTQKDLIVKVIKLTIRLMKRLDCYRYDSISIKTHCYFSWLSIYRKSLPPSLILHKQSHPLSVS